MAANTSLTRRQLTNKANQWLRDNPKIWKSIRATSKFPYTELQHIIENEHGKAHWRDRPGRNNITGSLPTKSDPGVPFTLEDAGNGRVKFKSTPTRAATRGNPTKGSSGTRQYLERASTDPSVDFRDSQRAMAEARAAGRDMDGGHKTPLDRTVAGQEFKVQSGRGTVQEYRNNFAVSGQLLGHRRENIEPQDSHDNRVKQRRDYAALDSHLKFLEQSARQIARPRTALPGAVGSTPSKNLKKLNRTAQQASRPRLPLRGFPGAFSGSESGSEIVDQVNGNQRLTGYAATLGVPIEFF